MSETPHLNVAALTATTAVINDGGFDTTNSASSTFHSQDKQFVSSRSTLAMAFVVSYASRSAFLPFESNPQKSRDQLNLAPARLHRAAKRCRPSVSHFRPASQQCTLSYSRVKFPSLRPDSFRHPIDVRATQALKSLIGLEAVLRALLRTAEQTMFFENIATGVKVTPKQYPSIHAMLEEACAVLDIPQPQLYVRQNPIPNAYTLAVQGNKPFIVLHSSLIDLLTPSEVQAVLAHELGHLKSEHGVWVTMANLILLLSTATLGGNFGRAVYELLNTQLMLWQRAAELSCDRAMLLVIQDPAIAMSTLMKLAGGTKKYADEMNVEEYLSQAEQFDEASKTRLGRLLRESMTSTSTHPLPILRVRELKRWSESNHFRALLRSGKPLTTPSEAV